MPSSRRFIHKNPACSSSSGPSRAQEKEGGPRDRGRRLLSSLLPAPASFKALLPASLLGGPTPPPRAPQDLPPGTRNPPPTLGILTLGTQATSSSPFPRLPARPPACQPANRAPRPSGGEGAAAAPPTPFSQWDGIFVNGRSREPRAPFVRPPSPTTGEARGGQSGPGSPGEAGPAGPGCHAKVFRVPPVLPLNSIRGGGERCPKFFNGEGLGGIFMNEGSQPTTTTTTTTPTWRSGPPKSNGCLPAGAPSLRRSRPGAPPSSGAQAA